MHSNNPIIKSNMHDKRYPLTACIGIALLHIYNTLVCQRFKFWRNEKDVVLGRCAMRAIFCVVWRTRLQEDLWYCWGWDGGSYMRDTLFFGFYICGNLLQQSSWICLFLLSPNFCCLVFGYAVDVSVVCTSVWVWNCGIKRKVQK